MNVQPRQTDFDCRLNSPAYSRIEMPWNPESEPTGALTDMATEETAKLTRLNEERNRIMDEYLSRVHHEAAESLLVRDLDLNVRRQKRSQNKLYKIKIEIYRRDRIDARQVLYPRGAT